MLADPIFNVGQARYIDHCEFMARVFPEPDQLHLDFFRAWPATSPMVIDFSTEHWGVGIGSLIDDVYDVLEHKDSRFLILSHRPQDHLRRQHLMFFPHEYHKSRKNFRLPVRWNATLQRKYLVSCLNHLARPHRIYNWYQAQKKHYFSQSLWSMHQHTFPRPDEPKLPKNARHAWRVSKKQFPDTACAPASEYVWSLDHPAYLDSYINVITEHSVLDGIYLSEKTWKPIVAGQLFLMVGNPGSIDYLKSVGVDVFDDIIDHDYYQGLKDWVQRIDRMHEILEDLVKQDLTGIYAKTAARRIQNREKFLSGAFDPMYLSAVQQRIDSL